MKICTNCKHCHVIKTFTWKEDWWIIFVPPAWVAFLTIKIMSCFGGTDSWCSVGYTMAGAKPHNGSNCVKMRLGSACGPDAKLFEERS